MREMVEQIASSKYANGLYPATSMTTLLIAQTAEFDWDGELIRIHLDAQHDVLIFDFQETSSDLPKYKHWIRHLPTEEGFSYLEKFLRLKKWVVEYGPS